MPQFGEYSNNSDEDEDEDDEDEDEHEEDEDDDEVENFSEDDLERELQAKFMESGQYEAQEGASSIVMKLQKQIYYAEKKLQEIQKKAQRQKNLLMKVENLMLKNHVQSVLEKLELEEKNKNEQLVFLQEKLKYFLKK
ncbi:transcription initiation factor TFIID subunit 7-like [Tupaia chinensis]|uniref:transcription initiation factor TFIID subunit 7-like n=1 Tax=Tupaia chinensis TaxID=246437 RepID=UPI0003C8C50E|nr:transcription initiation factor TFIID subunit 7-like [Tupaia chinensis]